MRLNSALVYRFLFVSAVLADSHPEKQQPPFLNHVEKSIDPTTVTPPANKWAGGVWKRAGRACFLLITTDFTAGTFTVPTITGDVGSGFNMAVGMGDSIGGFVFGVGITAKIGEDRRVSYEAWCTWLPTRITAPADFFTIATGNVIGAVVQRCSRTSGAVALINFYTGTVWASFVSGNSPLSSQESDTVWVLTTLPNDIPTLPDASLARFLALSYTFLEVHIDEKWGEPRKEEITTPSNIVQNGRALTSSSCVSAIVTINDLQT